MTRFALQCCYCLLLLVSVQQFAAPKASDNCKWNNYQVQVLPVIQLEHLQLGFMTVLVVALRTQTNRCAAVAPVAE
jgi:hypothetical protein